MYSKCSHGASFVVLDINHHHDVHMQHSDRRLAVATGFDMMVIAKTPQSLNFTFKDEPLQQVCE